MRGPTIRERAAGRRVICGPAIALLLLASACTQDVDPPWQLDHDRVIAVRATPSRIAAGEVSQIDALLGRKGDVPLETEPDQVTVISPMVLAGTLAHQGTHWTVTTPSEPQLVAARQELALPAGDPVPVRLRMTFAGTDLVGLKVVWLGVHVDNPVLDPVTIDGQLVAGTPALTVAPTTDIPLVVEFDDTHVVNWLTSCGNMHDFDLPAAYLRVEPEDPQTGMLGVVVRDALGGVAWRLWPITAE
ncbi:MAG: hypothetical protein IPQ07_16260 [Myxococcales bacterium]|nr:hypothetical protein [Myxococcales bacterium]